MTRMQYFIAKGVKPKGRYIGCWLPTPSVLAELMGLARSVIGHGPAPISDVYGYIYGTRR